MSDDFEVVRSAQPQYEWERWEWSCRLCVATGRHRTRADAKAQAVTHIERRHGEAERLWVVVVDHPTRWSDFRTMACWYGPGHGWGTTYGSVNDLSIATWPTRKAAAEAARGRVRRAKVMRIAEAHQRYAEERAEVSRRVAAEREAAE